MSEKRHWDEILYRDISYVNCSRSFLAKQRDLMPSSKTTVGLLDYSSPHDEFQEARICRWPKRDIFTS